MRRDSRCLISAFAAIAIVAFAPARLAFAQTAPPPSLSTARAEANKALARRVFDEILNQGNFRMADEIYARDFINHGLHRDFSLAEDQAAAHWEKTVVPDLTVTAALITADQDYVTVVWTARGTNTRRSGWFPATGVKVEERGITVWRIADGRIHDEWTSFDIFSLIRQAVAQLKWWLLGAFVLGLFVIWAIARLIRKAWTAIRYQPTSQTR